MTDTARRGPVPKRDPVVEPSKPRLLSILGPGLITGASDDDPSGIATYSQAGAQFSFAITWTLLLTYPLMAVTQEISAIIGRTTGRGIFSSPILKLLKERCAWAPQYLSASTSIGPKVSVSVRVFMG